MDAQELNRVDLGPRLGKAIFQPAFCYPSPFLPTSPKKLLPYEFLAHFTGFFVRAVSLGL